MQHMLTSLKRQQGQAVTEFAVMATVMVPLFLMVPLLAKVSDLNQTAIQASRYVAWERTVSDASQKSDAELSAEIQRRLFSKSDMPVHTGKGSPDETTDYNPFWRGYAGGDVLRSQVKDVGISIREEQTPGALSSTVSSVLVKAGSLLGKYNSGANFDLENDGLYVATVGANVGSNDIVFFGGKACSGGGVENFACITRQNVILADTWDASGPWQVEERTKAFVPMGLFSKIGSLTDIVGSIPFLKEWKRFEPGYVAPDVVPVDRLSNYED